MKINLSTEDKLIIGIALATAGLYWLAKRAKNPAPILGIGTVSGKKIDINNPEENQYLIARLMNITREFTRDHYQNTSREEQDKWALETTKRNFKYPKKLEEKIWKSLLLFCYNGKGPFGKIVDSYKP